MFIFLIYLEEKEKKYNLIVPSKWFLFLVDCSPAVDEDNYSICVLESCQFNRSLMKLAEYVSHYVTLQTKKKLLLETPISIFMPCIYMVLFIYVIKSHVAKVLYMNPSFKVQQYELYPVDFFLSFSGIAFIFSNFYFLFGGVIEFEATISAFKAQ